MFPFFVMSMKYEVIHFWSGSHCTLRVYTPKRYFKVPVLPTKTFQHNVKRHIKGHYWWGDKRNLDPRIHWVGERVAFTPPYEIEAGAGILGLTSSPELEKGGNNGLMSSFSSSFPCFLFSYFLSFTTLSSPMWNAKGMQTIQSQA